MSEIFMLRQINAQHISARKHASKRAHTTSHAELFITMAVCSLDALCRWVIFHTPQRLPTDRAHGSAKGPVVAPGAAHLLLTHSEQRALVGLKWAASAPYPAVPFPLSSASHCQGSPLAGDGTLPIRER